jgi:RNA polymerase sigma factor (sigma-70 family)
MVEPDLPTDIDRANDLTRLRRAILALPVHHREVIVLCELHELSYEQAAQVVGCPVGTIRSRLNRARRALLDSPHTGGRRSDAAPEPRAGRRCLA